MVWELEKGDKPETFRLIQALGSGHSQISNCSASSKLNALICAPPLPLYQCRRCSRCSHSWRCNTKRPCIGCIASTQADRCCMCGQRGQPGQRSQPWRVGQVQHQPAQLKMPVTMPAPTVNAPLQSTGTGATCLPWVSIDHPKLVLLLCPSEVLVFSRCCHKIVHSLDFFGVP